MTVLWTAFTRAAIEAEAAGDERHRVRLAVGRRPGRGSRDGGVAAGLDYVERTAAFTRTGRHGARSVTGHWADTQGLTAARFLQHTSRENDPQLHVHQAVLNKVQTPDGRWLALDGKAVHAARAGAGAISRARARARPDPPARASSGRCARTASAAGSSGSTTSSRTCSPPGPAPSARRPSAASTPSRRCTAEPANAIERATIVKKVTLATRPGKTSVSESPEEMNARWHAEAVRQVAGGLGSQAHRFRHVLDHARRPPVTLEHVAANGPEPTSSSGATESTSGVDSASGPGEQAARRSRCARCSPRRWRPATARTGSRRSPGTT